MFQTAIVQPVNEASHLCVRVFREASTDLHHTTLQSSLPFGKAVPGIESVIAICKLRSM